MNAPLLELKDGRFYRTRNGRKVGPIMLDKKHGLAAAPGFHNAWYSQDNILLLHPSMKPSLVGRRSLIVETPDDLVAEWVDKPKADFSRSSTMRAFRAACELGNDSDTIRDFCDIAVRDSSFIAAFLNALADKIHAENVAAGWWMDLETGQSILHTRNVPEMLCLIHSEISEAMEGHRKKLMDDKLPHRPMLQVELVDAVIRILDLAGSRMAIEREAGIETCDGYDHHPFGNIFEEKRAYNRTRPDHRRENRAKEGGKAF